MLRIFLAGSLILGSLGVAFAQSGSGAPVSASSDGAKSAESAQQPALQEIDQLQERVATAWEKAPLMVRRAIFVSELPELFGGYVERASNVFKPGEKLLTYVEPVGYTWKPDGDFYDFGVAVDFVVKSADGKVLAGQDGFAKFVKTSHAKVQELMLTLTLSLNGARPGNYVLVYTLHDIGSTKTAHFVQPFAIAE